MIFPDIDSEWSVIQYSSGFWRSETIPGLIEGAAARHPERVALRDAQGHALTYRSLVTQAAAVSGYLAAHGIGRGDIVTLCLPNRASTVVAMLGVMRLGAVVNPVPVTYGRSDISYVTKKCRSRALFLPTQFRSTDFKALLDTLKPDLDPAMLLVQAGPGAKIGVDLDDLRAYGPMPAETSIHADDPVAVLFTSGTESRPKGAVHTHNTILFGERALAGALHLDARDIAFMASPITHTTGFMHGVVMTLTLGGTLSLLDIFDGTRAAEQMRAHACSWTMGATPFLADVVSALRETGRHLPALRYFLCGGAPVPEATARAARDVGMRVLTIYGSTESPPHTVVHPEDPEENAWTTDGRPLAGIETRIVGPDGQDVPDGTPGEQYSRGANMFIGYLGEPELTAKDVDDAHWYHSGDLARRLPDGSIRIVGRLKDIIVRGGQNISVREVEDHLAAHPDVAMVAVVAIPHTRLGETGCAVIVPKQGTRLTLDALAHFLTEKGVARFKLPERLEIWPELPMTPSGKIQKFLIRQKLDTTNPPEGAGA